MPPFPLPHPSPPAPVSRIELVSRSVACGIRSRTFSLGKSIWLLVLYLFLCPYPPFTLALGEHAHDPFMPSPLLTPILSYVVSESPVALLGAPGRRKMKCLQSLRNVESLLLCQWVERCCLCLGFLAFSQGALELLGRVACQLPLKSILWQTP